jgi:hypothetical protein
VRESAIERERGSRGRLYTTSVGAEQPPHTRRGVWPWPVPFLYFLFYACFQNLSIIKYE